MLNDLSHSVPDLPPTAPDDTAVELPALADADAPEFRRDPVTGRWVVIAPERSRRPIGLEGAEPRHRANGERQPCPFCPGQEHETTDEVLAIRAPGSKPDGPGWRLRVVPNKFPAVRPLADGREPHKDGVLFDRFPGFGRHEVVIETPDHLASPTRLPDDQFRDVLLAYRDRLLALAADRYLHYATVFKNVGAEAGASLGHSHSQILATPVVPDAIRTELGGADDYYTTHRRCVFCDIVASDLADGRRVIAESPHFVAISPFAARFGHEMWVLPKSHASRYESITPDAALELAGLMKRVLRALDVVLAEPAYNWFLHTAPLRSAELPYYHWHFEIIPRTARTAGFEWGAGCFINAVPPETAAAQLRAAISKQ
jgi:UDPglucose--hexose-1-phosphate uridylyltransferase